MKVAIVSSPVRALLYIESTLRRTLAALLVLFFVAGPLLPVLAIGRAQSEVPACCRKDGAHRCSVRSREKSKTKQDEKPSLGAACPFLSHALPIATVPQSSVPPSSGELGTAVVPIQPFFSYSVATVLAVFFPGNPKRGPPQFSSDVF